MAPSAIRSNSVRRMLGFSLHGWENVMVVFLIIAGFFALLAGAATWAVVRLQREEIARSQTEFEAYKLDAGKQIAKLNARAAEIYTKFAARRINDEQRGKLIPRLRESGFKIRLRYEPEMEAVGLMNNFMVVLQAAGAYEGIDIAAENTPYVTGIWISDNDPEKARSLRKMLVDCCDFEVSIRDWRQIPRKRPPMPLELMSPEQRLEYITNEPEEGVILLHIGHKPVPEPPQPEMPDWVKDMFQQK